MNWLCLRFGMRRERTVLLSDIAHCDSPMDADNRGVHQNVLSNLRKPPQKKSRRVSLREFSQHLVYVLNRREFEVGPWANATRKFRPTPERQLAQSDF